MVGNPLNYTKYDVMRVFLAISKNVNLSRSIISKELEIGEGSVRTILDELKNKKLIVSYQTGHVLTERGKSAAKQVLGLVLMKNNIPIDFYRELGFKNTALHVKSNGKKIEFNILHRDSAIKNGAESCLIFAYRKRSLVLPFLDIDNDFEALAENFGFSEGDVMIVTFAKKQRWAEISALAVADELMRESKIRNELAQLW